MKKRAEREWEREQKRHNDPLKETQLYSSIACHSWCCGMWGQVRWKPLIIPPDRTTERLQCTARHQHHATLHKPHTSTHWPAEKDIGCIFILCTSKCAAIHSVTFLLFFSFTLSHKPFSSVSFLFFYLAPLLSESYCLLSPISSKNWRDKEYVFQNRLGENDNCKWKRQRLRSLMSLPQRRVAGFLKSAGSSVHFSSSLKRTPNEMLLDSLFKGNLPLFISPTVSVAFAVKVKCVIFLMFKYYFLSQLQCRDNCK